MASPIHKFMYQKLNVSLSEIRLFRLLPGADDQPVRGIIEHHYLNSSLQFHALSYTWGDELKPHTILLEIDKALPVGKNLHSALRDLRHATNELLIWIDAICINQEDVQERNHQVQLMRYIFTQAQCVNAWLDREVDMSEPSFQKLMTLDSPRRLGKDVEAYEVERPDIGEDPKYWSPVIEMLTDSYWDRLWIQQELALASRFNVHCRKTVIPGEAIVVLTEAFTYPATAGMHRNLPFFLDWANVSAKIKLLETPSKCLSTTRSNLYSSQLQNEVHDALGPGYLLGNLMRFGHLQVTNPKDRLYGLLGMSRDVSDNDIQVDYSTNLVKTFVKPISFCITKHLSLDFLCAASFPALDNGDPGWLPSWIPNWTAGSVGRRFKLSGFQAGGSVLPELVAISQDGVSLQVRGFVIDRMELANSRFDTIKSLCDLIYNASRAGDILEDEQFICTLTSYFEEINDSVGSYWHATLEERKFGITEVQKSYFGPQNNSTLLEDLFSYDHVQKAVRIVAKALFVSIVSRRLARLCSGRWGLMFDVDVELTDEIWILFGCRMPMVLRPQGANYKVVSPIYVHGWMNKETIEGLSSVNAEVHSLGTDRYHISNIQLV